MAPHGHSRRWGLHGNGCAADGMSPHARVRVLDRDNWTCRACGDRGSDVHHLSDADYRSDNPRGMVNPVPLVPPVRASSVWAGDLPIDTTPCAEVPIAAAVGCLSFVSSGSRFIAGRPRTDSSSVAVRPWPTATPAKRGKGQLRSRREDPAAPSTAPCPSRSRCSQRPGAPRSARGRPAD